MSRLEDLQPKAAVRGILPDSLVTVVNVHRDYSITGTQVSVEVYDDRVEIVKPGGL